MLWKHKQKKDYHKAQRKNLDTLLKQGEYLKLAEQEECDPNWKSFAYNLPKGKMMFLINRFVNTLLTGDNLKV